MAHKKEPKAKAMPTGRHLGTAVHPENTNNQTPTWSIAIFDREGPWGKNHCDRDDALWSEVFPKLRDYESMTWAAIQSDRKRNHSVPTGQLIREAQNRLLEIGQDDAESLFRFRLSGEIRVWGIRTGRVFKLLWLDLDHAICPSTLKHT